LAPCLLNQIYSLWKPSLSDIKLPRIPASTHQLHDENQHLLLRLKFVSTPPRGRLSPSSSLLTNLPERPQHILPRRHRQRVARSHDYLSCRTIPDETRHHPGGLFFCGWTVCFQSGCAVPAPGPATRTQDNINIGHERSDPMGDLLVCTVTDELVSHHFPVHSQLPVDDTDVSSAEKKAQ